MRDPKLHPWNPAVDGILAGETPPPPCEPIPWACGHVAHFAGPERRKYVESHICPVCTPAWHRKGCDPAPSAAEEAKAT